MPDLRRRKDGVGQANRGMEENLQLETFVPRLTWKNDALCEGQ